MAAEASSKGCVANPADNPKPKLSPLKHLTQQSARFGTWEVGIFKPSATQRQYVYENKPRTSYQFQCILVSTDDPTQYVLGDSHGRGTNEEKIKKLKAKFQEGLVFQMSKVALAANVNRQYINTPQTEVVSMLNTSWSAVLGPRAKSVKPEPNIPISASMRIDREQLFDALALVYEVSDMAGSGLTNNNVSRMRLQATLTDGSVDYVTGKVVHMPVTIFADARPDQSEPQMFRELREAASNKTAIAFFRIHGKQPNPDATAWSFTSGQGFFFEAASDTAKGRDLENRATVLLSLSAEEIILAS